MPQKSHPTKPKFTHAEFGIQLIVSQDLENDPQVNLMILLRLGVDQDVVHENYHKLIKIGLEHPTHEIHECRRSIRQSEWHHCELEVPIPRLECCLRDVFLPNSQLMINSVEIYLGVDPRSSQLIKQIINLDKGVPILDSSSI